MNSTQFLKLYEALICCRSLRKFADDAPSMSDDEMIYSKFSDAMTPNDSLLVHIDKEIVNEISGSWGGFTGEIDFPILCKNHFFLCYFENKYDGQYRDASISYIEHAIAYLTGKIVGGDQDIASRFNVQSLKASVKLVINYHQWKVSLCTFGGYWSDFIASHAKTKKDAITLLRAMLHNHECFGV